MDNTTACIGFSLVEGIGPLRFKLLKDYFGSAKDAWVAPREALQTVGLGAAVRQRLLDFRAAFQPDTYKAAWSAHEIKVIAQTDTLYPSALLEIPDPPIVLYIKGTLPNSYERCLGVVGTRKPTPYGKQVTEKLTGELVHSGMTIVSGLARGVDGIAHRTTLDQKGTTIAVLGCGVDIIYPPDHQTLYFDIIKNGGAVISEVPPGRTVSKGLFPARNRIISGISRGVLVTEGTEDSGSLITAQCALDQGREVFAVPGPISSYLSAGPAKLIKQGAKVVTCVADILDELKISPSAYFTDQEKNSRKQPEEQQIIDLIASGTVHFDDIVRALHLSPSTVGSMLTMLELDGILQNLGNGEYGLN